MKINFYLPGISLKIIGGYKVVFQYANYLVSKGNDVCIYYDINGGKNNKKLPKNIVYFLKRMLLLIYPNYWFKLNKKIQQEVVYNINNLCIKNADISIATAYRTFELVNNLDLSKGKKIYLIQGYEKWGNTTEEMLINTYKSDMPKIVVSKWLKQVVDKYSPQESFLLSNGIDKNVFEVKNPIELRKNNSIIMLYNAGKEKNCEFALNVLKDIKNNYKDINVKLFGFPKRSKKIPNWMEYYRNVSENEVARLMNESAIFLCPSLSEGFGLPGLEAMACGCALISTNCKGVMEYANNDNSIIIDINDIDSMYEKICLLLDNNSRRIELANLGQKSTEYFDISKRYELFEDYLKYILENK